MHRNGWTRIVRALVVAVIISVGIPAVTLGADVSSTFSGHHVNAGTVSHEVKSGKHVLTLSKDFPIPDAPDPHWRLVDSKGNAFLLDRVKIKDDRINTSITVPGYVSDIAKVEIWYMPSWRSSSGRRRSPSRSRSELRSTRQSSVAAGAARDVTLLWRGRAGDREPPLPRRWYSRPP